MTTKQKKAALLIAENHGNVSKAMKEVGYSPNTYKKPSNLTRSNGYKEFVGLLAEDKLVADKVNEGLEAYERDHFSGEIMPDFSERRQTAKLIGEFKGYLKNDITVNQNFDVKDMKIEIS